MTDTPARGPRPVALLATAILALAACGGGSTAPADPPEPPRLAGLDPVEGRAGSEVRVMGERLGSDPAAVGVTFDGVVAEVVEARGSSLRVVVPALEPGPAQVVVTVDGRASDAATFRVLEPPFVRPPPSALTGSWQRTLVRTAADGACPDPLPEREIVELRLEDAELVLGEVSGTITLDGRWRAVGSIGFDDGSTIRLTLEARFTIDDGALAIVGELVREHFDPVGATTCTETYDFRLGPTVDVD